MASFYFKAVARDGKLRTGTLAGETGKAVAAELRRQGLVPVFVGDEPSRGFRLRLPVLVRGRRRGVLFFTQELSTLLKAGVPLDRSLAITAQLSERPAFRRMVEEVLRTLKGGKSLADSLRPHPEYFSELYVNMVRAGEASGSLAAVFERLAGFETSRDELRGYIISSMIYPALLSVVGLASILVLLNFVAPRFAAVFEQSNMAIPPATRMMLGASEWLRRYALPMAGCAAAAGAGFYLYIRTSGGRLWWDTLRLRMPLLGSALRKAETARFARAMGTLVANGVALVQSIAIAGATLSNRRIAGSLDAVARGVKRGEGIAGPLGKTGQFPPLAAHLLTVGEETGRLDEMFGRMAEIYEAETRVAIRRFTALFEPLIILVMGVMVGALILSMLIAITSINEVAV
ncbi:MAG: type II secretion system F family protein [Bryobacterales bacterium]|nr:type II secretion system F family protein [Bryobacterales bacterium]